MPRITKREAERIADKLRAELVEGRNHQLASLEVDGIHIGQFGIRRGPPGLPHDYVPRQIHVSQGDAVRLAQCPMSYEDWLAKLREKGLIPKPKEAAEKKNQQLDEGSV